MKSNPSLLLSLTLILLPSVLKLIYMMDQEKRWMELEVARMLLHKQKNDKVIAELQSKLREEKKKEREEECKKGEFVISVVS